MTYIGWTQRDTCHFVYRPIAKKKNLLLGLTFFRIYVFQFVWSQCCGHRQQD